jgi:hypothetical protein
MMKFDSSRAWKEATAAISANREVVYALAGVFFLLPGLAIALLFPSPEPTAGMDNEAAMAMVSEYYGTIMPFVIPMVLFQAAGTLAMLTLLTDRTGPTVGQAIRMGVRSILPYFLAQIVLGLGVGLVGGLVLAIGMATGVPALTAIGGIIVFMVVVYAMVKASLVAPVIAVEGERNPIAALKRSWRLVSGNTARIAVFYLLVLAVFLVVMLVATSVVGIVVALLAGAEAVELAGAVVSSTVNAVLALYFVAIIAATHRQLAGPSASSISATFE